METGTNMKTYDSARQRTLLIIAPHSIHPMYTGRSLTQARVANSYCCKEEGGIL